MKVKITGVNTGISLTFYDTFSYKGLYGYSQTGKCYQSNAAKTKDLIGNGFAGFNDNFGIISYDDKGVGEIGQTWRGNSLGARIISWNFFNSYFLDENGISTGEILNAIVNLPDEVIEVVVNDTWTCLFHFIEDTSTEQGVLALESADVNNGAFWSEGSIERIWYVWEENPFLVATLPQTILNDNWYPLSVQLISVSQQNPVIKIGGEMNGTWDSFNLTTDDQELFYDNSAGDEFIFIDSDALTVKNELDADVSANLSLISGTELFPIINVGVNNYNLIINGETDIENLNDMPTDMQLSISYEKLVSTLPTGTVS